MYYLNLDNMGYAVSQRNVLDKFGIGKIYSIFVHNKDVIFYFFL